MSISYLENYTEEELASLGWMHEMLCLGDCETLVEQTPTSFVITDPAEAFVVLDNAHTLALECGDVMSGVLFHTRKRFCDLPEVLDFYHNTLTIDVTSEMVIVCLQHMQECSIQLEPNGKVRFDIMYKPFVHAVFDFWI
jgi:hypothetical protein